MRAGPTCELMSALKVLWLDRWEGEPFDKNDPVLIRRHFPEARIPPAASELHDAYFDVQASIAELACYLGRIRVAPAGAASDG